MTIPFDPNVAFRDANLTAVEQEQSRLLLWDRLSDRAASDDDFRQRVIANPRAAVEETARTLTEETGGPLATGDAELETLADRARATYSAAVPGVQSARVEELIFATIDDIRKSFKIALQLSQVLFYSGLTMMVFALLVAVFGSKESVAILFGTGGLVSVVVSSFIIGPVDRVQRAASNLIQLQMAYLAYYKQLSMLGAMSGSLSQKAATGYSSAIQEAAFQGMRAIRLFVSNEGPVAADKSTSSAISAEQGKEPAS